MTKSRKKRNMFLKIFKILFGITFLLMAILYALSLRNQRREVLLTVESDQLLETSLHNIEGLPEDFPVYQNSEFITLAKSENGQGKSYIWETNDEAGLVYEYLRMELRIRGWKVANDSSIGSSFAVSFEKTGREGFLGVFKGSGGKTVVSVSIREQ